MFFVMWTEPKLRQHPNNAQPKLQGVVFSSESIFSLNVISIKSINFEEYAVAKQKI